MIANSSQTQLLLQAHEAGKRLDRFLSENRDTLSREKIKKVICEGGCLVNEKICLDPSKRLKFGDKIIFTEPEETSILKPEDGDIDIVYKDEDIVIVNKPAGLTVHPAISQPEGTLVHRLLAHFPQIADQGGLRPGIVHRIDKDTSGLLCIALTEKARLQLIELFAERKVQKEYLALVWGILKSGEYSFDCIGKRIVFRALSDRNHLVHGRISLPIGRNPFYKIKMAVISGGKEAFSDWQVIKQRQEYALIAVRIHTGRTHQIRVHMEAIGHPLLGDTLYKGKSGEASDLAPRQMLHAWKMALPHPRTGEILRVCCPPPQDFLQIASYRSAGLRKNEQN